MQLGDIVNGEAARFGTPLEGVRILAAEQMQSLPFATQLLARLGADVVKVEHPGRGESGRGSYPHMPDPDGRPVGATFLRNNLGKRSVAIDLKSQAGRELFLALVPRFDVVCENFKAGTMDRLGLGYQAIAARHPEAIVLSLSGFGTTVDTPYRSWPAYAAIVEGMSGIYEYRREAGRAPRANPVGALGDISSALFGAVGVLAALRHRDRTGEGQHVDVAMLDAVVAMTDIVTNLWSMGVHGPVEDEIKAIVDTFAAGDGYFVLQCVRPQHFTALAEVIGRPEWNDDDHRFAGPAGWTEHRDEARAAIEAWAAPLTKAEAAAVMALARTSIPNPLREATLVTLIGLLAATGMRVGEAIRLERPDLIWAEAVIVVRDSKFGKSRMVPLHETTIAALTAYAEQRDRLRPHPTSLTFFVSTAGTAVFYTDVCRTFRKLVHATGVGAGAPCRPTIHGLRHSFAVQTLLDWYRDGHDVQARLPRLATFLGHRDPISTYWYLSGVPELLSLAAVRLEASEGQQP